jgi:hypothetical protein
MSDFPAAINTIREQKLAPTRVIDNSAWFTCRSDFPVAIQKSRERKLAQFLVTRPSNLVPLSQERASARE